MTVIKLQRFAGFLEELFGDQEESQPDARLFGLFKNENYMLNCRSDNTVCILVKKKATINDLLKAYIHARLIDLGLESRLHDELKNCMEAMHSPPWWICYTGPFRNYSE